MNYYDLINALFEGSAAALLFYNCVLLHRDKGIRGVSIRATALFFAWGIWNLFYYPHLGQHISFTVGIAVAVANGLWVCMALYYRHVNREAQREKYAHRGFSPLAEKPTLGVVQSAPESNVVDIASKGKLPKLDNYRIVFNGVIYRIEHRHIHKRRWFQPWKPRETVDWHPIATMFGIVETPERGEIEQFYQSIAEQERKRHEWKAVHE